MANAFHLQRAIKNVKTLYREIERGWHVPLKYRSGFSDEQRAEYLAYLATEEKRLEKLLAGPSEATDG
jgi:hypothetical protein